MENNGKAEWKKILIPIPFLSHYNDFFWSTTEPFFWVAKGRYWQRIQESILEDNHSTLKIQFAAFLK